jgi:hypothetical protein
MKILSESKHANIMYLMESSVPSRPSQPDGVGRAGNPAAEECASSRHCGHEQSAQHRKRLLKIRQGIILPFADSIQPPPNSLSQNPPSSDEICWLLDVSLEITDPEYVRLFCEKAIVCVNSPFVLFELLRATIKVQSFLCLHSSILPYHSLAPAQRPPSAGHGPTGLHSAVGQQRFGQALPTARSSGKKGLVHLLNLMIQ